jgi:hypothetical protein
MKIHTPLIDLPLHYRLTLQTVRKEMSVYENPPSEEGSSPPPPSSTVAER